MKILLFILIFLCIGAFFIISQNNLALSQEGNLNRFVSLYGSWLISTTGNLVSLTGNIVKMDWLPSS
jgi:hypothetical protein